MRFSRLLSLAVVLACRNADSTGASLPYQTTFTTIGDTVVAATTGDVPDHLLRRYVIEWRATGDSGSDLFGDCLLYTSPSPRDS